MVLHNGHKAVGEVFNGPESKNLSATDATVFVGKLSALKSYSFEKTSEAAAGGKVTSETWKAALDAVRPTGGLVSLFLNKHKVLSLPDSNDRHTSPSGAHVLTHELRAAKFDKDAKALRFVLICEYAHCVALVTAIARVFPLYSRATAFVPKSLFVELRCTDVKEVPKEDLSMLADLMHSVRATARLADTPANELTTDAYVEEALAVARALGVETTVIRGEELEEKGFGGIYHVGKAAATPPAFVVLSYKPKGAKDTFALVGKGIVYDTGGMHLKTSTHMLGMKRDMAGSAALLGAFYTLVRAGFTENLHMCLCIAENAISPIANRPDDVITLLSGKTVEITNTDAEGRLVLGDGVFYAKEMLKAKHIINMATLTGGQIFMTGRTHSAVMCSRGDSETKAVLAGLACGDLVHPMIYAPDQHEIDLHSPLADMTNAKWVDNEGPKSGTAALFVGAHIGFGKDVDWVHVDMLAPSQHEGRATGWGVAFTTTMLGGLTASPMLRKIGGK